jgi:uracil-DNA glycosylase
MAKAKSKAKNIKKKKIDFLESIKSVTKWINNANRNEEQLIVLIEKHKIKNTVAKRILSYNYGFPYIIKYFNTYMNNLYEFDSYDTRLLIKSLVYIMEINNRCNSRMFMYIKSATLKDDIKVTIKKLIHDYLLTIHNIKCNRLDLNIYYKLFKLGVIKDEDLLEIDRLLNGDKPSIKSFDFINYDDVVKPQQELDENQLESLGTSNVKEFGPEINSFISSIKEAKASSDICKTCSLYARPTVVLDSNLKEPGEVDVCFIGLNPRKADIEKGLPFIGDLSVRNIINQLPRSITWTIFNIIPCESLNKNEITGDIITKCLNITSKIFSTFPTKLYIPIGDEVKSTFGIKNKITTASGKIFSLENNVTAIPLISPSSISHNSKNKEIYEKSVKNIIKYINPNIDTSSSTSNKIVIDKKAMVNNDKDLLLLDIKKIENNQVLMIYTDLAGNKKYLIKPYIFPVLIKKEDWSECNMITDYISDSCQLTEWQKINVSKKCNQILKQLVNI